MSDFQPPTPLAELPEARKKIDLLAFAPGSDTVLLAVQGKRMLDVWDLADLSEPARTVESGAKVVGCKFWPDEGGLLVWSERGAQVLDLETEEVVSSIPAHEDKQKAQNLAARVGSSIGTALSFIPMAAGGVWMLLPMLASSASAEAHHYASVDVSPDGRALASIAHNHRVYLHDVHTGEKLAEWKIAMSERSKLVCLPSGRIAAGLNSKLFILDAAERKPVHKKTAHLSGVRGLVRMPGGLIATIGENQNLRLWTDECEPRSRVIKLRKQVEEAYPIDATRLVARATNRRLYLIDTEAKPAMTTIRVGDFKVLALAVSDDGGRIAIAGNDRIVRTYETRALIDQDAGA